MVSGLPHEMMTAGDSVWVLHSGAIQTWSDGGEPIQLPGDILMEDVKQKKSDMYPLGFSFIFGMIP